MKPTNLLKCIVLIICSLSIIVNANANEYNKTWDQIFIKNTQTIEICNAIEIAIDNEAPICELMKTAIDLEFNAYDVLTCIFSSSSILDKIDIDQLCLCATEIGIHKSIIVKSGIDNFNIDEVTQSQCMSEGLGYTENNPDLKPITVNQQKDVYSQSIP